LLGLFRAGFAAQRDAQVPIICGHVSDDRKLSGSCAIGFVCGRETVSR
jgi:hypothetical protein